MSRTDDDQPPKMRLKTVGIAWTVMGMTLTKDQLYLVPIGTKNEVKGKFPSGNNSS
jgi:hypothetical protein